MKLIEKKAIDTIRPMLEIFFNKEMADAWPEKGIVADFGTGDLMEVFEAGWRACRTELVKYLDKTPATHSLGLMGWEVERFGEQEVKE